MMQPSPDPPYGMMPPTGQMGGLSLGPRPPQGYVQQPPSNTGLPQSNFPTRSMAVGPPPNHPQMMGPPGQIMGPPAAGRGMMGPPSGQPYQMQGRPSASMPPPNQAPQMMAPTAMMGGPPGQMMMGPPGSQQIRAPVSHMTGPPTSMMTGPTTGPPASMPAPNQAPGSHMMSGPPASMPAPNQAPGSHVMSGPPASMPAPNQAPGSHMMSGPPASMPAPNQAPGSHMMSGPPPSMPAPNQAPGSHMMSGPPPSMPALNQAPGSHMMSGPPPSMPALNQAPGSHMMSGPPASMPAPNQAPGSHMMSGPPATSMMMMGPPGGQQLRAPTMTGAPSMGPPGGQQFRPGGHMTGPPPQMAGAPPLGAPPMGPPMMMGPSGGQFPPPGPGGYPRQPGPPGGLPTAPVHQGQPKARIDPDQMPNPVAVMRSDQEQRGGVPFMTSSRGNAPPLVTTHFRVQDDGNCSPHYLRATMYSVPCTKDLLNGCKVPLGLVLQPLAAVPTEENTMNNTTLVDHGPSGPLRCNRCKAYMNPYARFVDGGRQYLCPICQCSNEVPPEYFCHLDHQGRRTDTLQRPELRFGSVEYIATKDYCKEGKLPLPPAYIFMIDVSYASVQTGLLSLLSQSILSVLDTLPGSTDERGSPIQVGFVTYDKVIHFYNVKETLAQPQMMVLTDVSDVFVPMVDGFLVSVAEARTMLESFLSQLPELFATNKMSQVILEPVLRAGMEALKASGRNGRLYVFHSSLPTAPGPGVLKNRQDPKLLGTDKEKTLLAPAGSVYQKLAEECVKFGVGVELFLFPGTYCDVATLAKMAATTGGELHYYKNYQTSSDGEVLMSDLRHSVQRVTGFDAVMRVRACTGLRPTAFYGAFHMSNTTDIELGNIDADKAIAVEIKHDDKLREDDLAFFQAALLYTDVCGRRRLRVHNIAMSCSSKYQDLYRSCDIDSLMSFLSKSIVHASLTLPYKSIRESFSHQCAVILSCYRKHCSSQSPPGQLILPESLKLLPMYANCLLKSDCLLAPPVVTLDEKSCFMYLALCMPTSLVGPFLYPRLYSLHDVSVDEQGLPPLLRCTGQKLSEAGVYVVENGLVTVLWLGQAVPNDIISQLFGVGSLAQVNTDLRALPALDHPLSFRVRGIVAQLQASRQHSMKLVISKQRDKTEVSFRRLLKEDKGAGQWEGTSYIDFLCNIHREIKEILS